MGLLFWLVGIGLILVIFMFLKAKDMRHKIYAITIVLLILFFYISASKIFTASPVDVKSFDGVVQGGKLYFSWLGHAFSIAKDITGKVVSADWSGNSTKIDDKDTKKSK
ncbi:MAG: hypothetical protein ABIH72_05445 [archaeon]